MSIPQAVIKQHIPNHPGPGQYETQTINTILPKNPSYTIAKNKLSLNRKRQTPGPGFYDVKQVQVRLKKSISYTFKKSKPRNSIEPVHADPIVYNPNYLLSKCKAPAYSINKSQYSSKKNMLTPGPGDYINQIKSTLNKGIIFTTETKKLQTSTIPGPGDYQTEDALNKLTRKGPSALMPTYKQANKVNYLPGPGEYQTIISSISKCGGIIPKQIKKSQKQITPGPGQYMTDRLVLKQRHPRYAVVKQSRTIESTERQPGPGGYDILSSYQKVLMKAPKVIIPKSEKSSQLKDIIPGPGSYIQTETTLSKKGGVIVRSNPRRSHNESNNPGPGQYRVSKYAHLYQSKGYTIARSKYQNPEAEVTPGPGYYNSELTSSLPQIRLKSQKSKIFKQAISSQNYSHKKQ